MNDVVSYFEHANGVVIGTEIALCFLWVYLVERRQRKCRECGGKD